MEPSIPELVRSLATLAAIAIAIAIVGAACGDGGAATADEAGEPTNGTTTAETTTTTALPGGELVLCESPAGFTLGRPKSWSTNAGNVVPTCSRLHPEPFELSEGTDERVTAIAAYVDPVAFEDVVAADAYADADRAATTIDGLRAVRLEYETDRQGLWPAGTPITAYAVDLTRTSGGGARTLFLDTIGLEGFDYERNQIVLDRVARTVRVTLDDVRTERGVVARYEGRDRGFTVRGDVVGPEACLRIVAGGDRVCTEIPEGVRLLTVERGDGVPILGGVTGADVFRVTAERRDGEPVSVLPAPIGDGHVRGFAFTFGLDAVERLRSFDVSGAELDTIQAGG